MHSGRKPPPVSSSSRGMSPSPHHHKVQLLEVLFGANISKSGTQAQRQTRLLWRGAQGLLCGAAPPACADPQPAPRSLASGPLPTKCPGSRLLDGEGRGTQSWGELCWWGGRVSSAELSPWSACWENRVPAGERLPASPCRHVCHAGSTTPGGPWRGRRSSCPNRPGAAPADGRPAFGSNIALVTDRANSASPLPRYNLIASSCLVQVSRCQLEMSPLRGALTGVELAAAPVLVLPTPSALP